MVGSVVGPGFMFVSIIGALNAAFSVSYMTAGFILGVPVVLFMVACFILDSKIQLLLAQFLSVLFSILMMAVLVGVLITVKFLLAGNQYYDRS